MTNQEIEDKEFLEGFVISGKQMKRYGDINRYCALEGSGSVKKLRYVLCAALGVSFRKAGEYVDMLETLGSIKITNGSWTYTSDNSFNEAVKRYKQVEHS